MICDDVQAQGHVLGFLWGDDAVRGNCQMERFNNKCLFRHI